MARPDIYNHHYQKIIESTIVKALKEHPRLFVVRCD